MKWSVAITAAPRKDGYYLDRTVQSLEQAGWPDHLIFAEPGTPIPKCYEHKTIIRRKTFGDWSNWASALFELLLTEPDADYYLMCEDDFVLCRNIRSYLEKHMAQLGEFGAMSFYTPCLYRRKNFQGFHNECEGQSLRSTLTIVMPHDSVVKFFADIDVQQHRTCDLYEPGVPFGSFGRARTSLVDRVGNTVKDAIIGRWSKKVGLPVYFHTPSLGQHIGMSSTLTMDPCSLTNGRLASDFVGEDFDAESIDRVAVDVRTRIHELRM